MSRTKFESVRLWRALQLGRRRAVGQQALHHGIHLRLDRGRIDARA